MFHPRTRAVRRHQPPVLGSGSQATFLGTSIEDRQPEPRCVDRRVLDEGVPHHMTEQNALGTESRTAVIDNGSFGTREVVFSTGRLARQAAGPVIVQLGETTVLSRSEERRVGEESRSRWSPYH